uniref:Tripartite motif-containing protein 16-like n=1 Tax=Erpetoichthys calabaricus TaxID=27687 RepID=A0A8C4RP35_ERPCA
MAEAELFRLKDEVTCCICLDTLSNPVSILCGHSFCLKCLTEYWDQNQDCRCPQCRRTFTKRPKLHRNTALHLFENYKNMLTDPDGNLKEQFCAQHEKRLEMFCINDKTCVCVMCVATGHNEHIMVELEMERIDKQVSGKAEGVMERLEKDMEEQKKRDADLRELSETKEHNCILLGCMAQTHLFLSKGNKKVTCDKNRKNGYPSNPDNFSKLEQILCNEALTGTRCYWEVECTGESVEIGVTYNIEDIDYENYKDLIGYNDMSWCLWCFQSQYFACHDKMQTVIHSPYNPRIGVYLDWPAGSLSFYRVSLTMTLLHRFNTTFTKPLYPAFYLYHGTSVTICNLMP